MTARADHAPGAASDAEFEAARARLAPLTEPFRAALAADARLQSGTPGTRPRDAFAFIQMTGLVRPEPRPDAAAVPFAPPRPLESFLNDSLTADTGDGAPEAQASMRRYSGNAELRLHEAMSLLQALESQPREL